MNATITVRKDRLAELRTQRGLDTGLKLAAAIGTTPSNWSRIENGLQNPGPNFIGSLCYALNTTLDDLFEITPKDDQ